MFLFSYMYKRDCSSPFLNTHDGVIIWKHFPHYWPIVRGTHRSPLVSPCNGWKSVCFFVVLYYYLSYNSYLVTCIKTIAVLRSYISMMTAKCGSIFRVAGLLCGEPITGGFPLQGWVIRMCLCCVALLSILQSLFNYIYKSNCSSSFLYTHDDVMIWKHLPHCWPLVWGSHRSPVASPCKSWKCVCSFLWCIIYVTAPI